MAGNIQIKKKKKTIHRKVNLKKNVKRLGMAGILRAFNILEVSFCFWRLLKSGMPFFFHISEGKPFVKVALFLPGRAAHSEVADF